MISEVWVAGWMFDSLHGLALRSLAERSPINSDAPWAVFIKYSVLIPSVIRWAMQKTEHPDGKVLSAADMTWRQQFFLTLGFALKFLDAIRVTPDGYIAAMYQVACLLLNETVRYSTNVMCTRQFTCKVPAEVYGLSGIAMQMSKNSKGAYLICTAVFKRKKQSLK